ncbi:MAG: hypothetical protein M3Q23_03570 [Actinomycetota bacterium]|nr:hypothetical protein [Actinomycetota bacterium]
MGKRRSISLRWGLAVSVLIVGAIAFPGTSGAAPSRRPDAWIKLCGPANTCLFAPWHPWFGNNAYNTTGHGQLVSAGVEEGNMIRFWVLLQNDGTLDGTLRVKGCSGSQTFPVLSVNEGAWRSHTNQATITSGFKAGTASFPAPAGSAAKNTIITITFRASTTVAGASYTCHVTVSSSADPATKDTVVAKMTTI